MNGTKLKEALAELQAQRNVLDAAITQIQNVLAMLSGVDSTSAQLALSMTPPSSERSYIDDAIVIFESVGQPLHVKELAIKIGELRRAKVPRGSLESSLTRHIAKVDQPRIAKFKPSTYGLPAWKPSNVVFVGDPKAIAS